jgi:hypothetical protein
MTRRSQKIKKSLTTFFNYTEEGRYKFKVNSNLVNFERNTNDNDNNIPSCSCNNYDVNTFCEHVYYILLFFFKVNVRNRILRKNKFTDNELENIFLKQYRFVSASYIRRVPIVRLQRRVRPQPPARRRIVVRRAPARRRIVVRRPVREQMNRYQPHPPSEPRPPSRRPNRFNRNSVHRRRQFVDVLASSYRNNQSEEAGQPAIPILVPDDNPLNNLRHRVENLRRRLRRSPNRVDLHIPRPRVFVNLNQGNNGQNFPSPIRRISNTRHIASIAILTSPQRNITSEDKCTICLNELYENRGIVTRCSVCSNDFHNLCLDTWIVSKIRRYTAPSCPLCRSRINLY